MSQRLLASHSALFTKGVALKAGDWRNQEVMDVAPQNSKMMKRSESVTSMASLQKQFGIQRPASSEIATNSMMKSRSYSALLNAICDDKENSIFPPEQPLSSRPSLINLVQVKTDDISKLNKLDTYHKGSCHASELKFPKDTWRQTMRSRPSMPNLSSLAEEKEEDGTSKPVSGRLSSLFNVSTHETDYAFEILPLDRRIETTSPESKSPIAIDASNYYIRSRLSVPNLSSLVEEEDEESLCKKTLVSPTRKNKDEVIVDTFKPKITRQVDIRGINSSDLASLKEEDPFMYYSIPAVRNSAWQGEDADPPSLQDSGLQPKDSSIYKRKSRISVECWNLTIPNDIAADRIDGYFIPSLGDAFFDFSMDDEEDDEDPIDDFLMMSFSSEMVKSSCL